MSSKELPNTEEEAENHRVGRKIPSCDCEYLALANHVYGFDAFHYRRAVRRVRGPCMARSRCFTCR